VPDTPSRKIAEQVTDKTTGVIMARASIVVLVGGWRQRLHVSIKDVSPIDYLYSVDL
jgi:hypothetical protein